MIFVTGLLTYLKFFAIATVSYLTATGIIFPALLISSFILVILHKPKYVSLIICLGIFSGMFITTKLGFAFAGESFIAKPVVTIDDFDKTVRIAALTQGHNNEEEIHKQKYSELNIKDKIFKNIKNTGLVGSYEVKDKSHRLYNQAFTYDQALVALLAIKESRYDVAKMIFDFYEKKFEKDGQIYTSYDVVEGGVREWYVFAGPILWLGIALAQYQAASGDKSYQSFMLKLADLLERFQQ